MFVKDALFEAVLKVLDKTPLIEMAINRSVLENRLQPALVHALNHYVKMKAIPNGAVDHWVGEIKGAFSQFEGSVYSHNKKPPTKQQWLEHSLKNSLSDYDKWHIEKIHSKIKKEYPNVKEIDPEEVESGFKNLMARCFDKLSSKGGFVERDDIY